MSGDSPPAHSGTSRHSPAPPMSTSESGLLRKIFTAVAVVVAVGSIEVLAFFFLGTVVAVSIGGAVILAVLIFVVLICLKRMRPPLPLEDGYNNAPPTRVDVVSIPPTPAPEISLGSSKSKFTYEELERATDVFSDANLLGQGGFGYVHRGHLPNGKQVAVKQLKAGSSQGEREFLAEVEIISRVHHRHLVSLVGYCITESQRFLVYEFVPNNTLHFHLHEKGRPPLDWPMRLRIALGSAKGLAYLHEDCQPKTIHRDIKAANILLDLNFEAKVADFGLAKTISDISTHVSTSVAGTFGYLAPEYASTGQVSEKSDVYAFGVVLLELITGRQPVEKIKTDSGQSYAHGLVDWARPLLGQALEDKNFDVLIDPRLKNDYNHSAMTRMVACAAASVRHLATHRPRMSQVVRALQGDMSILSDLNEGIVGLEDLSHIGNLV